MTAWIFAAGNALAVYLAGWSVVAAGSFELHRNLFLAIVLAWTTRGYLRLRSRLQ